MAEEVLVNNMDIAVHADSQCYLGTPLWGSSRLIAGTAISKGRKTPVLPSNPLEF